MTSHNHKPYTNATFTKRVDHDGGRHHTRRSGPEPAVCEKCNAVFIHRRWAFPGTLGTKEPVHYKEAIRTICPACHQEAKGQPGGFVYASGDFLEQHHEEIMNLLNNEAQRAMEDNPLNRIMETDIVDKDEVVITTTTEHLAQRLGHALEKAYHGEVHYGFSHENKLTRVTWHRD